MGGLGKNGMALNILVYFVVLTENICIFEIKPIWLIVKHFMCA